MSTAQYSWNQISKLFDATKDTDHDLRFMALSDLDRVVAEAPENLPSYQRGILAYAHLLVQALDDQHSEVQNQAVKCFVALAPLLKTDDVLRLVRQLMHTKSDSPSLIISSVYTMAVKNILENVHIPDTTQGIRLVDALLSELLDYDALVSRIDVIEILNHVTQNLGPYFSDADKVRTYGVLVKVLFGAENTVSKAAISGLGELAKHVDERQLSGILALTNTEFAAHLARYTDADDEYFHLHSLRLAVFTAFFKNGGDHVTAVFSGVLATVFGCLSLQELLPSARAPADDADQDFDRRFRADQVRDDALLCLETILANVGAETVLPHAAHILDVANELLVYDPFDTLSRGDDQMHSDSEQDDDDNDEFDFSDNDDFEFEADEEESNDYDLSWLLRKNSARLVGRLVESAPLALRQLYTSKTVDNLLARITDASANVSNEAISALTTVVANTSKSGSYYTITFYNLVSNNIRKRRSDESAVADSDVDMECGDDPFEILSSKSSRLCEVITSEMITAKNAPRFNVILPLVSQLTDVLGGLPDPYLCGLVQTLHSLDTAPSADLFRLYSSLLQTNSLDKFGHQLENILSPIIAATSDASNYELSLEAFTTATNLFKVLSKGYSRQFLNHDQIMALGNIIAGKITSRKFSNEIKQKCLHTLSELVVNYDAFTADQLNSYIAVYNQSLDLESLVEISVSELSTIVSSVSVKITPDLLQEILAKFVKFVRLTGLGDLRGAVLECLVSLSATGTKYPDETIAPIVKEIESMISERTLSGKQISDCLTIFTNFIDASNYSIAREDQLIFVIDNIRLQVNSVDETALFAYTQKMAALSARDDLFQTISEKFSTPDSKELQQALPGILASLATALGYDDLISKSENYVATAASEPSKGTDLESQVAFLGYIGTSRRLQIGLDPFLILAEQDDDPGLKSTALKAIANISTFDVPAYFSQILDSVSGNESLVFALRTLTELKVQNGRVTSIVGGITEDLLERSWSQLVEIGALKRDLTSNQQELNAIAECLTSICALNSSKVGDLVDLIESTTSIGLKYVIVSTVKYFLKYTTVLSQSSEVFDRNMSKLLEKSSLLIFNDNLQLKQTSIQALIVSLHNKPLLTLPILSQLLTTIMEKELAIKKEYIDTIQIGPFKHKIDNALDLRKSIYEVIYTLLTTIENSSNLKTALIQQNLNHSVIMKVCIEKGLKDDNDVIQLSSIIIAKIVKLKPAIIFQDLELLTAFQERCSKIINRKMKETETKQILEKHKESVKSIRSLITNIDKEVKTEGVPEDLLDSWRKFAFVNGLN